MSEETYCTGLAGMAVNPQKNKSWISRATMYKSCVWPNMQKLDSFLWGRDMKLGEMGGHLLRHRRRLCGQLFLLWNVCKSSIGQIKSWIFIAFLKGGEGQHKTVLYSQAESQLLALHIHVLVKHLLQTVIFIVWMEMLFHPTHPPHFSHRLREHHRAAIKVIRRMQYFVAKKKFQVSCE